MPDSVSVELQFLSDRVLADAVAGKPLALKGQFVDVHLEGRPCDSGDGVTDVFVAEGKGGCQEGKRRLVEGLLPYDLSVLQVVEEHK